MGVASLKLRGGATFEIDKQLCLMMVKNKRDHKGPLLEDI